MVQDLQKQPPPTPGPTPVPVTPQATGSPAGLTIDTEKQSYLTGETFKIIGTVGKPEFGKVVRIDVYRPDGAPLAGANGLVAKPERDGSYSYDLGPMTYVEAELMPGEYTVQATFLKQSNETKFMVE
jgi:hypothetical protein